MNRICTKDKNWTEFGCCVITECKGRPNANQCVLTTKRSTNNWFLLQCHSNDRPAVEQGIVVPHANGVRKRLTIYSCTMCMKASVAVIWQSFVAANENECKLRDSQTTVLRSQARADNISICSELSQSLCNTPIRRQAYHTHSTRTAEREASPNWVKADTVLWSFFRKMLKSFLRNKYRLFSFEKSLWIPSVCPLSIRIEFASVVAAVCHHIYFGQQQQWKRKPFTELRCRKKIYEHLFISFHCFHMHNIEYGFQFCTTFIVSESSNRSSKHNETKLIYLKIWFSFDAETKADTWDER